MKLEVGKYYSFRVESSFLWKKFYSHYNFICLGEVKSSVFGYRMIVEVIDKNKQQIFDMNLTQKDEVVKEITQEEWLESVKYFKKEWYNYK